MPRAHSATESAFGEAQKGAARPIVAGSIGARRITPRSPAARRIAEKWKAARRLGFACLLVVAASSFPPSSKLMASQEQSDSGKPSAATTLKPVAVTSADLPFTQSDSDAEQLLLELANQSRSQAGLAPLKLDAGLSRAAYAHAQAMVSAHQLSHQCAGEPALALRLAAATHAQLDEEGENVALDGDAESAHRRLMLSPPHRANLLNASYNEIGLAVMRTGDQLYVVQDFARALPNYSTEQLKDEVAGAVMQARSRARKHNLSRVDLPAADDAACSMAHADKLETSPIQRLAARYTVLTYTTLHPEILPENAHQALRSSNLRNFSVGGCYAKTETYPTGAYWVVVALD